MIEIKEYVPEPHECKSHTGRNCNVCFSPLPYGAIVAEIKFHNLPLLSEKRYEEFVEWMRAMVSWAQDPQFRPSPGKTLTFYEGASNV